MENDETFALIGIIALPVAIFALILFFTITDYNFNETQFSINDTNVSINESWVISVLNNSNISIDVNVRQAIVELKEQNIFLQEQINNLTGK